MQRPVQTAIQDGVGTLTLNRPDAYNAITIELSQALEAAIRELAPEARTIVIRGAGKSFCVGGDFKQMDELRREGTHAVRELFAAFHSATRAIAEVPVPVICAVHGIACAGGFELALASDIVLLSASAQLADIHLKHAMVPGGGSTQRLPRMVGAQRALALILTGDRLSATEAVDWGIAYRAFDDDAFDEEVDRFAADMAARDPDALRFAKHLIREGLTRPLNQGIELELETVLKHLSLAADFVKGER